MICSNTRILWKEYKRSGIPGFPLITDYLELSTNINGTLTSNGAGNVTASSNSELAVHTLRFNIEPDVSWLTLYGKANSAQGGSGVSWHLSEIDGTVTAEVIPESSTFALIAGLVSFAWIIARRRKLESV